MRCEKQSDGTKQWTILKQNRTTAPHENYLSQLLLKTLIVVSAE